MKTLLFIGYDLHLKTKSSEPVEELLEQHFLVTKCYMDLSGDTAYAELKLLPVKRFDVVVCWQVLPPRDLLDRCVEFDAAAFFPMLDACPNLRKVEKWWPYRDFNIICFSKFLEQQLLGLGLSARYVQYFPEPRDELVYGEADSAFLWFRRDEINPKLVGELFAESNVRHVHIHNAPDFGSTFEKPPENGPIQYSYSTWFERKSELNATIGQSAFYMAPRSCEGIGMSFLEAMAMGKCVVAPNQPTMNEYIQHGETGVLYSLEVPQPLSPVDVREIQRKTSAFMKDGYAQWHQDCRLILDWLSAPVALSAGRLYIHMFKRFFRNPWKVLCALLLHRGRV